MTAPRLRIAVPDLISNSYFPAIAAVELGKFKEQGFDASIELIFPVNGAQVGRRVFPDREASLIASLVQRDLPFYSTAISRVFVGHRGRRVRCRRVQSAAGVGVGTASPAVVMFCMVSAASLGMTAGSVRQGRLEPRNIVLHHVDVGRGRPFLVRQRIGEQRAADLGAGLLGDLFHQPRI